MSRDQTKPAVGYVRMSTDQQQDSPVRQRRDTQALADRPGYRIVRWYEDHGLTGTESSKRKVSRSYWPMPKTARSAPCCFRSRAACPARTCSTRWCKRRPRKRWKSGVLQVARTPQVLILGRPVDARTPPGNGTPAMNAVVLRCSTGCTRSAGAKRPHSSVNGAKSSTSATSPSMSASKAHASPASWPKPFSAAK